MKDERVKSAVLSSSNKSFSKKADVKISRISNSKSPPWNLVKFLSEFFLGKCFNKSALNYSSFDSELMLKYKNT